MRTFFNLLAIAGLLAFSATANAQLKHDADSEHQSDARDAVALTDAEMLAIHVQGICPVTGEALGSMGQPVKVQMGEQNVYLCCKGCVGKQASAEHWKTIQANLIKAQGFCPVMDEELPADAESLVIDGRQIFVCCKPCIEKIKADPAAYLAKVDAMYARTMGAMHQEHAGQEHAEGRSHEEHKHYK